jgi:DNA-binding Lrp family transcriptional regulator
MEFSKIGALKLLGGGPSTTRELASNMGLSYPRAAAIVRELVREGYCEKAGRQVSLASNVKAGLLRKLADRYEITALLGGSSERLLLALSKALNVDEIQRKTGLSQSTVYQTLRRLMAIGAVRKRADLYSLTDDPDLMAFSELLRRERETTEAEPHAILIHSNDFKLKRVPTGKSARGSKTAFSLFARHGVEYASPHDYYVEPEHEVSIEEVLVHALRSAEGRAEGTMCAVFYLKNIDRIDPAKVKSLAKRFGVLSLWVDLQNYVRGLPVHDVERFLPWTEFVEKAGLYGIRVSLPPEAEKTTRALRELGNRLDSTIHAYLFGGANLLLRGLKKATKDLDIVVESEGDFSKLKGALLAMGFEPLTKKRFTSSDEKLNPSGIYVSKDLPRFDLFTKVICNALFLTEGMKARAEAMAFGKLVLHLLSLEDVFLLKSITEREGDLEDMATILKRGGDLRWGEILRTYFEEEGVVKRHFCFTILDNIELLQQRGGITIPIHGSLLRHCIDVGILQALAYGATSVLEIRKLIDFPEYTIRNRIEKLAKEGKISKRRRNGRLVLALTNYGKTSLF